jgi:L-ascorbate metabolism protein UlaG (beta-lactamase superfamily)
MKTLVPAQGGVAMSVKVTWYGHACLLIEAGGAKLLVDPFLTGNPVAAAQPGVLRPDFIFVSHGHGDHLGDALDIARRTGATVVSVFEISNYMQGQGIQKIEDLHIGGGVNFPWGRVKLTIAQHGSGLPDGSYGGTPCGFLFYVEGRKIYDACDTGLFYDMKLIGEEGIDLALLPIGDRYTMGPDDALHAVRLIGPKVVIPIHYNTFAPIKQDAHAWAKRVEAETRTRAVVLSPGDSYTL